MTVSRSNSTARQDDRHPFPRKSATFQQSKLYSDSDRHGYRFVMQLAGEENLTRPYAQHPWVHACVSAIARAVSSVPLVVQKRTRDGEMEPVTSGPLHDLLAMPNVLMSQRKWLESISQTQSLYGETFLIMMTRDNGVIRPIQPQDRIQVPDELWPVRGDLLEEIIDEQTQLPKAWRMGTKTGQVVLDARSVVQIAQSNPYNPLRGMGPMQAAYRTAAKDFVLDRYDEALLSNGGSPGGVLSVEGHLTDADQRAIAAAWKEAHGRPDQHRKTAVLPQGTSYEQIGFSPHEMEFGEMRAWNRETIMSVFGVTKPIIGLTEGLNYASSQSAFRTFWEVTVTPFLDFLADELQTKFVRRLVGQDQMYRISFDTSAVAALREDEDSKIERSLKLFTQGGRTFRESANLAGLELGDEELANVDQAYMPVSQVPVFDAMPMADPDAATEVDPEKQLDPMEATAAPTESLNGAQVASLLSLIEQVATGRLPKDTVVQLIMAAFTFSEERARRIVEAVEPGSLVDPDLVGQPEERSVEKVEQEEIDEVYAKWRAEVNMSASELRAWRDNPCSRKASVNPTAVIDRNLRLLETKKADWDGTHVRAANRAISFISRMKNGEQGDPVGDCPSKRDISLKNWAYDPGKGRRGYGPPQGACAAAHATPCDSAGGESDSAPDATGRDLGPEDVKLRQWQEWDASVSEIEDRMAKSAKRVLRDLLLAMRQRVRKAAGERSVRSVGSVKKVFTEAEIQRLLAINIEEFEAAMVAGLSPKIAESMVTSAAGAAAELGVDALLVDVTDPIVTRYLASKEVILAGIPQNLRDEVQRAMVRIVATTGEDFNSLREAIAATLDKAEDYFNVTLLSTDQRAQMIARTETTGAANLGRFEEFGAQGYTTLEWYANPGARDSHQALSGKQAKHGEEFGYGLRWPGDSQADASEVVNCRCFLLPGEHPDL